MSLNKIQDLIDNSYHIKCCKICVYYPFVWWPAVVLMTWSATIRQRCGALRTSRSHVILWGAAACKWKSVHQSHTPSVFFIGLFSSSLTNGGSDDEAVGSVRPHTGANLTPAEPPTCSYRRSPSSQLSSALQSEEEAHRSSSYSAVNIVFLLAGPIFQSYGQNSHVFTCKNVEACQVRWHFLFCRCIDNVEPLVQMLGRCSSWKF